MNLRQERIDRGLTIAQLAQRAGVTERVVQAAENGAVPHPSNALKLASFFGRRPSEIWPREEEAA